MAYYFVVRIKIFDYTEYEKYINKCSKVFDKYKGRYLAVDNDFSIIEGDADATRMVLIEFDTKEDFKQWYHSKEYQEILKYRLKGAECSAVLIKGLEK